MEKRQRSTTDHLSKRSIATFVARRRPTEDIAAMRDPLLETARQLLGVGRVYVRGSLGTRAAARPGVRLLPRGVAWSPGAFLFEADITALRGRARG